MTTNNGVSNTIVRLVEPRSRTVVASGDAALLQNTALSNPDVTIDDQGEIVVVTVTATAPGIIRGTSVQVEVTEALPVEGFRS